MTRRRRRRRMKKVGVPSFLQPEEKEVAARVRFESI